MLSISDWEYQKLDQIFLDLDSTYLVTFFDFFLFITMYIFSCKWRTFIVRNKRKI